MSILSSRRTKRNMKRPPRRVPVSLRLRRWARRRRVGLCLTAVAVVWIWPWYVLAAVCSLITAGLVTFLVYRLKHRPPKPVRSGGSAISRYLRMDAGGFEHAVADLCRRSPDCYSAQVEGGKEDRALDVLVTLHSGYRIHIQCKRYAKKAVDSNTLYAVNGTYRATHGCVRAVVVTTSRFTASAVDWNTSLPPADRLVLVDGSRLEDWSRGGPAPWLGLAA